MPVIMDDLAGAQWLDPALTTSKTLSVLLQPCPSEWIEAYEVSTVVTNPTNDSATCIEAAC
jgi:putative SOS response-associated peptidase YedK